MLILGNPSVFKSCFKKNKISATTKNVSNPRFSTSFTLPTRLSTMIQKSQLFVFMKVNSEKQDNTVLPSLIAAY